MEQLIEHLKVQIIEALNLEDISPKDIDSQEPLFGEGFGLDSIDALELVVMIEKHYGIRITDMEVGRKAFANINALAEFILQNKD